KNVDQVGILRALGIVPAPLDSPESAAADFAAAFDLAESGTAVAVLLPEGGGAGRRTSLPPPPETTPKPPNQREIELVADVLAETWAASRPVVLAGAGGLRAGARGDLIR